MHRSLAAGLLLVLAPQAPARDTILDVAAATWSAVWRTCWAAWMLR